MWILQAYMTALQTSGKTVHLVPVTINYDRIFEIRNISIEMVSGKQSEIGMDKVLGMFKYNLNGRLGRTKVIFGNSINLKTWL